MISGRKFIIFFINFTWQVEDHQDLAKTIATMKWILSLEENLETQIHPLTMISEWRIKRDAEANRISI